MNYFLLCGIIKLPFSLHWYSQMKFSSPKLGSRKEVGPSAWYKYYAGFSSYFVADALRYFTNEGDIVLDPWNGGGTTTFVAKSLNRKAVGRDINPALVIVAKSKILDSSLKSSLIPLSKEIVESASRFYGFQLGDGLNHWFTPRTVKRIRSIEHSIKKHLVTIQAGESIEGKLSLITPLAAFYYVALFKSVRELTSRFSTSNPTWIKVAKHESEKQEFSLEHIKKLFLKEVEELEEGINNLLNEQPFFSESISVGDSKSIDLDDGSADCVIASPPYCTRIDYVRATLPELSLIMRNDPLENKKLKSSTIGATTNLFTPKDLEAYLGEECETLLIKIQEHSSKASSTYYYKYFYNYFYNMMASIEELRRVLKSNGSALLVVQDSYYKDIFVDLPLVVSSMGKMAGFSSEIVPLHKDNKPYSLIHRHAKNYRNKTSATESAVILTK